MTFGGGPEIAFRDTLMSLHLALGTLDDAAAEADKIDWILEDTGTRDSYYGLWHLLTRVRWLYRIGDAAAGLALAQDAIPRIERMADRNLLERMTLLAAEGLGRVGRAVDGASLMAVAVGANPDPPLEMIAEASRVAGRLAAADDAAAAQSHFDRAGRIFQGVGNLTARAEVERDASDAIGNAVSVLAGGPAGDGRLAVLLRADSSPTRGPEARPPEALFAERIAALLELAAHPPLLATETLALVADTHASLSGAVVATDASGSRECLEAFATPGSPSPLDAASGALRIPIGEHADRTFEVITVPRRSPTARATLLAIERLVHASVALTNARQQERERAALWPEPSPEQQLGLICAAESMMDLVKTTRRVAASNVTVLISGETGVGKELFARALHQSSARSGRLFLPYNCTTVPRDMLDSQLFGYRRGAFTGAMEDSPGLIRSAAGGTLFLDEIGEMSAEAQPKLLRFLESGEIIPLGESAPQLVDVRIVAATNADLDQLVADGKFREDLYYRLNVIRLRVPPLRERREEVPLLVEYFLDRYSRELQKPIVRIADDTLEYLVLYRWPGNVRQLGNEIRRMVALAEPGAILMPEHLSTEIASSRRTIPSSERQLEPNEVVVRIDQPAAAAAEHLERALIKRALKVSHGNVEDAAKLLGYSRKGLYNKRLRFGL